MKKLLKISTGVALATALMAPALASASTGTDSGTDGRSGNVCADQIREYARTHLGTEVKSIWFDDHGERDDENQTAWARVEGCSGYYVFELWASKRTCTQGHHGGAPNYINTVWGYGSCRMP